MKPYIQKINHFFETLSSRPHIGALQITDASLQYVLLEHGVPSQSFSLRLSPGVMRRGKVQDSQQFLQALQQLHNHIAPENPKERVKIITCLPSAITYTQNFTIPNVGEKRFKESVILNLQMISPIPVEQAYMSWQLLGETQDVYELLGAFAEKEAVNQFRSFLERANFYPIIFEFPSLSLSWVINSVLGARRESFLVLNISSDGVDIFLLKNGAIYFDYFKSWQSIQGESHQINRVIFDRVLIEEIRKVINFAASRFGETLRYVFLVAPGLEQQVKGVIETNFRVAAVPLAAQFGNLTPTWYTVLGAAIRGSWDRSKDRFISLGTEKIQELFYKEQVIGFVRLWRNILTVLLASFLVLFGGAALLLRTQPAFIEERLSVFNVTAQEQELQELQVSIEEFNKLVASVSEIKKQSNILFSLLKRVREISAVHRVSLDKISIGSAGGIVDISLRAPNYDTVIRFKNALVVDPQFADVNLPLSKVTISEDRFVVFDISFRFTP